MKTIPLLCTLLLTTLGLPAAAAEPLTLVENTQYTVVDPAGQSNGPLITEFFSYGCPACRGMEGNLADWKKTKPADLKFEYMHVVGMNPAWDIYAKLFYTAEALGILNQVHTPAFNLIHVEHKPPKTDEDVVLFLAKFGVAEDKVRSTMKSFAVNSRMNYAKQKVKSYKLSGVPSFIVNNKYYVQHTKLGEIAVLEQVLSQLPYRK
jgi:thiol:disulfide interchange protein DsbA